MFDVFLTGARSQPFGERGWRSIICRRCASDTAAKAVPTRCARLHVHSHIACIFALLRMATSSRCRSSYHLFVPTHASAGNDFNERTCCLLAPSLTNLRNLVDVELDKEPFACVRSGDWQSSGLPPLAPDVVHLEWVEVVKHLCSSSKVSRAPLAASCIERAWHRLQFCPGALGLDCVESDCRLVTRF
jgi:hypothetical protein